MIYSFFVVAKLIIFHIIRHVYKNIKNINKIYFEINSLISINFVAHIILT